MRKIRQNDEVVIIAGKDKGKQGKVQRILVNKERVVVEGVNMIKRHIRPNPSLRQTGIVQSEAPIHVSNVKLLCPSCGKPARFGAKFLEDGSKARVCKACRQAIT
jgi:large subunit ribosomal protein L24